ncbi:MAG: hypothetical protein QOH44_1218, partial [Actinomycetota bacterium]|nr:hypothetical protein [Actinomycetota bacterium]
MPETTKPNPPATPTPTRPRIGWMPWILGVSGLDVIALVTIAVAKPISAPAASVASSVAISNQMSNLLEVNPLMTLDTTAPAVQLTDQNGRATSLSQFRGKAV